MKYVNRSRLDEGDSGYKQNVACFIKIYSNIKGKKKKTQHKCNVIRFVVIFYKIVIVAIEATTTKKKRSLTLQCLRNMLYTML